MTGVLNSAITGEVAERRPLVKAWLAAERMYPAPLRSMFALIGQGFEVGMKQILCGLALRHPVVIAARRTGPRLLW